MPSATYSDRLWVITSPRTASNLLVKMIDFDAQGARPCEMGGGYFFLPSYKKRQSLHPKPMQEWDEGAEQSVRENLQACFDKLQDHIEQAEKEGQRVLIKEHAFLMNHYFYESELLHGTETTVGEATPLALKNGQPGTRSVHNKTSIPDEFLRTMKPTFLVRHPALSIASLYRAMADVDMVDRETLMMNSVEMSSKWIRSLFDFYESRRTEDSPFPVVLDADDVMKSPEIMVKHAKLVGLDPGKLRFSWDKVPQAAQDAMPKEVKRMLDSLNASSGVNLDKLAGDIDLEAEAVKWQAEFGEEQGKKLEGWVRSALPDYEYMRSKRLTV